LRYVQTNVGTLLEKYINEDIYAMVKPSQQIGKRVFEIARDRFMGALSGKLVVEWLEIKLEKI